MHFRVTLLIVVLALAAMVAARIPVSSSTSAAGGGVVNSKSVEKGLKHHKSAEPSGAKKHKGAKESTSKGGAKGAGAAGGGGAGGKSETGGPPNPASALRSASKAPTPTSGSGTENPPKNGAASLHANGPLAAMFIAGGAAVAAAVML